MPDGDRGEVNFDRPLRDIFEDRLQMFQGGPLNITGQGNLVGAAGYLGMRAVNSAVLVGSLGTFGGVEVGFRVISHGVEQEGDKEIHTMRISAYSQDVARFAGKYLTAPSNIDFAARRVEVVEENILQSRGTASTWEIVTEVERELLQEQRR